MATNLEIEQELLNNLYRHYFDAGGNCNVRELREQLGWDAQVMERVVDEMVESDVITPWTAGGNYRITAGGIIRAETTGTASSDLLRENDSIRLKVLELLLEQREQRGSMGSLHFTQIASQIATSQERLAWNLTFMEQVGLIEDFGTGSRITRIGSDALLEHRKQESFGNEFNRISTMTPQQRGKAFEGLLARVLESQGWVGVTNARTNNEEMDLIVRRGREYYLIECKWLKKPVEAAVVHGLFGKLEKRAGSRGIVVSLTGFTGGAVEAVTELAHGRLVLLFGRVDVQSLVSGEVSLDDLLTQKFDALMMNKKALYE